MTRGPQPLPLRGGLAAERCAVGEAQGPESRSHQVSGSQGTGLPIRPEESLRGAGWAERSGPGWSELRPAPPPPAAPRLSAPRPPGLPFPANRRPRRRSSARPRAPAGADGEGRGRTCLVNRPHISATRPAGLGRANPSAASARPRPGLARDQAGPHASPLALLSRVQLAHGRSPPS